MNLSFSHILVKEGSQILWVLYNSILRTLANIFQEASQSSGLETFQAVTTQKNEKMWFDFYQATLRGQWGYEHDWIPINRSNKDKVDWVKQVALKYKKFKCHEAQFFVPAH